MTPQEKAEDLFKQYYSYLKANLMYDEEAREDAKQCALIAVDEISQHCYQVMKPFWEEVKKEIELL
jgi:hypothetical protein